MIIPLQKITLNTEHISYKNLKSLIDYKERETLHLEYKSVPNCETLDDSYTHKIYHSILGLMINGGLIIFGIKDDKKNRATSDEFGVPVECKIENWLSKLVNSRNLQVYIKPKLIKNKDDPSKEFLIVYVPKSYHLMRDPDTYEYWIRVISNNGPETIRMNTEQINQIFYTHDYVLDTVNSYFYQKVKSTKIILSTIPYDARILKQRINDFRNFIDEMVQTNNDLLKDLLLTETVKYQMNYGTDHTSYIFNNKINCTCGNYRIKLELWVNSNGTFDLIDYNINHFIVDNLHPPPQLRLSVLYKDLTKFLRFSKFAYDRFGINEFDLVINIPQPRRISRINALKLDGHLFQIDVHLREKIRVLEMNQGTFRKIFVDLYEEMVRCIDKNVITEDLLRNEFKKLDIFKESNDS